MSIRNFTKLLQSVVLRQPLQIPRQIPFRNFASIKPETFIDPKVSELNVKNQGNEDNLMLDKEGQLKKAQKENVTFDQESKDREAFNKDNDTFKRVGNISSPRIQFDNLSRATNASFTGNFEPSTAKDRDAPSRNTQAERKMTKDQRDDFEPAPYKNSGTELNVDNISEQNFMGESPSATHSATTAELTLRAKQLQTTTKRDYHQCLELCEQHPEKSSEQLVDLINKSTSANKQTY